MLVLVGSGVLAVRLGVGRRGEDRAVLTVTPLSCPIPDPLKESNARDREPTQRQPAMIGQIRRRGRLLDAFYVDVTKSERFGFTRIFKDSTKPLHRPWRRLLRRQSDTRASACSRGSM
jgi:hypothetical protein